MELPDFNIQPKGKISQEFLKRNIETFHKATEYIQNLPYGRNSNKDKLETIFEDIKGTCSTKHAVLKKLANENEFINIKLILGIFKMNAENTPKISKTLKNYNLDYIPEAHNYLKYGNKVFDFTGISDSASNFIDDLLYEIEIKPSEINQIKIQIHKNFLIDWLKENPAINYFIEELWTIREQCIQDLSE